MQPSVETGDLAIMRQLLGTTDLIITCFPYPLHYELEAGEVTVLAVALGGTERKIGISQQRDSLPSPAIRALQQAFNEVVGGNFLLPYQPAHTAIAG